MCMAGGGPERGERGSHVPAIRLPFQEDGAGYHEESVTRKTLDSILDGLQWRATWRLGPLGMAGWLEWFWIPTLI